MRTIAKLSVRPCGSHWIMEVTYADRAPGTVCGWLTRHATYAQAWDAAFALKSDTPARFIAAGCGPFPCITL